MLKEGLVVKLKSGGPKMTLEEIFSCPSVDDEKKPIQKARCVYFDEKKKIIEVFYLSSLEIAQP